MAEEDLGEVFDKIDVGVTVIKNDKIEFANDYLLQIIGYSLKEIKGKNCVFFAAKEEKNRLQKIKSENDKLNTYAKEIELWIVTKDGTRKYIRNRFYPIREGEKSNKFFITTNDITRKKQKETKVTASEFKKSKFLDYLTEHIIFYDTDMKIIWSNKIASDLLGQSPEDIVGETCYELWYQRDQPCDNCPVIKARDSGQEHIAEVITPDHKTWFVRGYPVYGDDGSLIGVAELASDITESKQTSKELQESEERFKQIFHNTNDGIFVSRRGDDGVFEEIIEANSVAAAMYGYTRDEFMKMNPSDFIVTGEKESFEFVQELMEKKELTFERMHKTKDGRVIIVEISSHLFTLGDDLVSLAVVRDITERKEEQDELIESEEKFRQIVQNVDEAIFMSPLTSDNIMGKFIEVNYIACEWTGFSREELLQMTPVDLHSPEETVGQSEIGRNLLERSRTTFEGYIIHKDGSKIPVEYNTNIFLMNNERVVLTTARDLREKIKAKEELTSSEERFRQIFHNTSDAIFLTHLKEDGSSSKYIEANDVALRWLGFSKEELLDKFSIDITAPEEKEYNSEYTKKIVDTGHATFETILFSKDRKRIPVEINSHIFELQSQKVILSIARDITERKKAQRDLMESEEKYRKLVETIPAAIIRSDSSGKVTFVNKRAVTLHGYENENQLLGKNTNELIAYEDTFTAQDVQRRTIEDGFIHDIEVSILRKDETIIPGVFHAAAIKDKEGSVFGFISVEIDITERKRAEEALKESEQKFRQIFQNAKDAIFIHKINEYNEIGDMMEVNKTACQWLGYTREELLEFEIDANSNFGYLQFSLEITEDLFAAGTKTFETQIENNKGELRPVEFSSHLFTLRDQQVLLSVARDITERKKAELSIRKSEERYRTLIETSPDAIILIDQEGRVSFANQQTASMYEYDDIEDMIGLTTVDFIAREDLEFANNQLKLVLSEGRLQNTHFMSLKKDGSKFPIELSASLTTDEEGKPSEIMVVIGDIEERMTAESALKESEEKFRQTFDQSNDGIFLHDLRGNILDVNLRVKELFGYSKSEFLQLTITQLHPITEQETSKNAFDMIEEKGSVNFETKFRRKDGSVFPADVSSSKFEIGGKQVVQGIVRDITERKKAEEELIEREEQYRQIFNNTNDAIFLTNIDEEINSTSPFIEVNDVACTLLGYERDELLKMRSSEITAPEDRDVLSENIHQIIKERMTTFENTLISKDGKRIPTEISSHVFELRGEMCVLSVSRDITERKNAERELMESEERYRKLFHEANDIIAILSIPRDGSIGNIVEANDPALVMTKYTREELVGLSLVDLVKDLTEEEIIDYFAEMMEKYIIRFEREFIRKDGTTFPVEITATPFTLKEELTMLVTARDITDRKRDEELRRQAYDQIAQNIEDFAELVDRIRNPLMGVIGYAELSETLHSTIIIEEARKIEEITQKISDSYLETEKVRKILRSEIDSKENNEAVSEKVEKEETKE
ncbi:MAG: PAS domain S-box protein [Candidatus Heimdallarchaeota archaeon]|nr:PAS domain S-box protein [Candidatus Heimdallarchaeota archaeon]MCK4611967.1 PAS domain S-box protein [Candidatus Heimdallarchaeota archaeon]